MPSQHSTLPLTKIAMWLCAALGIAGIAFWFWLQLDHTKPPQEPKADMAVFAATPQEITDQMRAAFLAGHSVRVEYPQEDGTSKSRDYWGRSLTEEERERTRRAIASVRRIAMKMDANSTDSIKQELKLASSLKTQAMTAAAVQLLEEGVGFITHGPLPELRNDDNWHYWNIQINTKAGGVIVYFPIDLERFPQVKDVRQRLYDIRSFSKTEEAYKWNSIPYEERRQLVDAANAARVKREPLLAELRDIESVPVADRTPVQVARIRELDNLIRPLSNATQAIPRRIDKTTLEWRFRRPR